LILAKVSFYNPNTAPPLDTRTSGEVLAEPKPEEKTIKK